MPNATLDGKLLMKDCEAARDAITQAAQLKIQGLYADWYSDCSKLAKRYKNAGDIMSSHYYNALKSSMLEQCADISRQIETNVKQSMFLVADAVIEAQAAFCVKAGLTSPYGATIVFGGAAPTIVNNLVTGQVYEGGWNLSKAIWGDEQKTMQDIYNIVAGGQAMGESVYDTAKKLEQYVNPMKRKPWNFVCADGKPVYKKQIDYNAQRLVRTLSQHAYQQAAIGAYQQNPFIQKVRWLANGSRVCPLCQDMDGQLFDLGSVPFDHPNGMCVMVPVIDDNYIDRLANWVKGESDDEIDRFALNFGYDAKRDVNFTVRGKRESNDDAMGFFNFMTGGSNKGGGSGWNPPSLTLGNHEGEEFDFFAAFGGTSNNSANAERFTAETEFLSKYANNCKYKQWQGLKNNLTDDEIAIATQLKERSGLSWKAWYEQYLQKPGLSKAEKATNKLLDEAQGLITEKAPTKYAYEGKINPQSARYDIDDVMRAYSKQSFRQRYDVESDGLKHFNGRDGELINIYSGSPYAEINDYMRRRRAGQEFYEIARDNYYVRSAGKEYMEEFEALADKMINYTYHESMVVRRTGGNAELAQMLQGMDNPFTGQTMDFKSAGEFVGDLVRYKDDNLLADINNRLQGTEFTFNNFVSTSCDSGKQWPSNKIELFINAPNGVHGRPIMSVSRYGTSESEVLLSPGQKLRIDDIRFGYGYGSKMQIYATALL